MEKKVKNVKEEVKETKKKGMNLPNKITCIRLVLAIVVLLLLCLPWSSLGWSDEARKTMVMGQEIDFVMIIAGVLFAVASFTDFLDGYIARKNNIVTDFGKVMDAIADKVLVNGVLILLATPMWNIIPTAIVPVIIITRDIAVDSIKMVSGSKGKVVAASWPGKIKTICMMIGVTLAMFYNMPFAFIGNGIHIDYLFIGAAVVMSIVSGVQYFMANKEVIFNEM